MPQAAGSPPPRGRTRRRRAPRPRPAPRSSIDGGEVVERAGAHLAGLRAHDRRRVGVQRPPGSADTSIRPWASVGEHDLLLRPDPEEPECTRDRHVALGADDHAERRRTGQAPCGEIPAGARVDAVTGGREARDVRHLAAGDERERRRARAARGARSPTGPRAPRARTWRASARASPVFWSQVDTSQSAAIDAGSAPPMTKPKNRPEPIAVIPGSSDAASSSTTSVASDGPVRHRRVERGVHLAVRPLRARRRACRASRGSRPRSPPCG